MHPSLANAVPPDSSIAIIIFLAECLFVMGAAFALALIPILLANRRAPRRAGSMRSAVVLWAALTCGTALYVLVTQYQWSKTYIQRVASGYYDMEDPALTAGQPGEPWIVWGALAAGYVALLAWSAWPTDPNGP